MAMKPHPVARAPMTRNPDRTRIGRGPLHVNHGRPRLGYHNLPLRAAGDERATDYGEHCQCFLFHGEIYRGLSALDVPEDVKKRRMGWRFCNPGFAREYPPNPQSYRRSGSNRHILANTGF
jgi:hypothetical protein